MGTGEDRPEVAVRPAAPGVAGAMARLLNAIIARGGTTAHRRPFDAARMRAHDLAPPALVSCVVAEGEGQLLGVQSLAGARDPADPPPDGWASIAAFLAVSRRGEGGALLARTLPVARGRGAGHPCHHPGRQRGRPGLPRPQGLRGPGPAPGGAAARRPARGRGPQAPRSVSAA